MTKLDAVRAELRASLPKTVTDADCDYAARKLVQLLGAAAAAPAAEYIGIGKDNRNETSFFVRLHDDGTFQPCFGMVDATRFTTEADAMAALVAACQPSHYSRIQVVRV